MKQEPSYKLLCIAGARPNFMKIAPVMAAINGTSGRLKGCLVHTGQHYDVAMNHTFFEQLGIPEPDVNLEVGSATHAVQTAEIMKRFEPVVDEEGPAAVLVVGDVNSTIACALVAAKKGIPVIHVEAGLRSYDRSMPEEVNRVLTDQISDVLLTTEMAARENLLREGIDDSRIHFVGNVMIDSLLSNLSKAVSWEDVLEIHGKPVNNIKENKYIILTLHRPSNVDDKDVLERLLITVRKISEQIPVIFTGHPRTMSRIQEFGLNTLLETENLYLLPPLGYLEMLGLVSKSMLVMTDSGGLQEETTALGIPCLTMRNNTERPVTVDEGTNTIVGSDPESIFTAFSEILHNGGKSGRVPELWDGKASLRITDVLLKWLDQRM
jgi:UDP-N-acetylglucosamine 2-epimerase (non-hydrolysing)